jgi:glycosyltransferase involved in cell wall biosynthesis
MRLLIYADTPTCNTGFGIVSKNIVKQLLAQTDCEIDILGINERGDHDELRYDKRIKIFPAYDGQEAHGRMKLIKIMAEGKYDHVIIIHDLITILQPLDSQGSSICTAIENLKPFYPNQKYHLYYPIDTNFPLEADLSHYRPIKTFDSLIPYTKFAHTQTINIFEDKPKNITNPMYHGVDFKTFYPLPRAKRKQLKKELFGIESKRPVISIIARNQWRKDIATSIEIFFHLKKELPEAFLYIHSKANDVGGNFMRYLDVWGLKKNEDYKVVSNLDVQNGVSEEKMNEIYNATDVLLSSAHGEGFGLPYLEAIATKTAIMTVDNGVEKEILPSRYYLPNESNYTQINRLYESSGQDGTPFPRYGFGNPQEVATYIAYQLLDKQTATVLKNTKDDELETAKGLYNWEKNVKILIDRLK